MLEEPGRESAWLFQSTPTLASSPSKPFVAYLALLTYDSGIDSRGVSAFGETYAIMYSCLVSLGFSASVIHELLSSSWCERGALNGGARTLTTP